MAAFHQRITHLWSALAGSSRPTIATTAFAAATRSRTTFSTAPFSTMSYRAWPDTTKLSLDHEIRRPQQQQQPLSLRKEGKAASQSTNESSEDWLDALNDSAEAEEAVRAYKQGGVVLGLSNTGGQLNFVDEDAAITNANCGGLAGQKQ